MIKQLKGLEKWAPLLLQVLLGALFFVHGGQKLFGWFSGFPTRMDGFIALVQKVGIPPFWAWVSALTEFLGGTCIFFGFLTRFWAAGIAIDMAVAVFKWNWQFGWNWLKGGYEFPLTLGIIALILVLTGPGSLSVDRTVGLEKRTP